MTEDEEAERIGDELVLTWALGGAVPYVATKSTSPILKNLFNDNLKLLPDIENLVSNLSKKLNVSTPNVFQSPVLKNNAFYSPDFNTIVIPKAGIPGRILGHEMGHAANFKSMGKFTNPYFATRSYGKYLTIPVGAGLVVAADPDSIKARSGPWVAASPYIITTLEEGIATGRGLNALWKINPSTVTDKLKDIGDLSKALLTYAAPAVGIVAAFEGIRRYRSFKKRNPEGSLSKFFFGKERPQAPFFAPAPLYANSDAI